MTITLTRALRDAAEAAVNGERVLFCAPTQQEARLAFMALRETEALQLFSPEIRSTSGREQITIPERGQVNFVSTHGNAMRGWSADKVFLSAGPSDAYLRATTLAASGGEVVRYTP